MKYFEFSKTVKSHNEDSCFACEDFAFVIDGASGMMGKKYSPDITDAKWFSNAWKKYLCEALKDKSKTLIQIMKEGVDAVCEKFDKFVNGDEIKDYPSATISIARRNNGKVEFFVLGDSPMIVKTNFGTSFMINDTRNNVNDSIAITYVYAKMKEFKENSMPEAYKLHPERVHAGRLLKNTPGFYYILTDDKDAIDHAYAFDMPEEHISKILIMTDGYSQIFDTFNVMSSEKLIDKIKSLSDIEKLYAKLTKLQEKDKLCTKHLRLKPSDDASIVCMDFAG